MLFFRWQFVSFNQTLERKFNTKCCSLLLSVYKQKVSQHILARDYHVVWIYRNYETPIIPQTTPRCSTLLRILQKAYNTREELNDEWVTQCLLSSYWYWRRLFYSAVIILLEFLPEGNNREQPSWIGYRWWATEMHFLLNVHSLHCCFFCSWEFENPLIHRI